MQNYTGKYGFIYIWRDSKRNKYYIGSHWGRGDDGYVCSSRHMKNAHKRRPQDFKRRILTIVQDRKMLADEEIRWLTLIKKEELGKRYYNLSTSVYPRWQLDDTKRKTVSEKISDTLKTKYKEDPEFKAKHKEVRKNLSTAHLNTPEVVAKRAASNRARTPDDQRYVAPRRGSEGDIQKRSESAKKLWDNEDYREFQINHLNKLRESNLGVQHRLGQKNSAEHNAKISESNRGKVRSEETKLKQSEAAKKRAPPSEETLRKRGEAIKESWRRRKENASLNI